MAGEGRGFLFDQTSNPFFFVFLGGGVGRTGCFSNSWRGASDPEGYFSMIFPVFAKNGPGFAFGLFLACLITLAEIRPLQAPRFLTTPVRI